MGEKKQKKIEQVPKYSQVCPSAIKRVAKTYLTEPGEDFDDVIDDPSEQLDKAFGYLYLFSAEGNSKQDCLAMAIRHISNLIELETICDEMDEEREEIERELEEDRKEDSLEFEDQYAIDGHVPIELDGDDFDATEEYKTNELTFDTSPGCCGNCRNVHGSGGGGD